MHEELLSVGALLMSYSQEAMCEALACPMALQPASGGTAVCQEPVRVCAHPVLMQALCLGIAQHVGHMHMGFWLLSNSITGLSQEDTPSVYSINIKYPFKIFVL